MVVGGVGCKVFGLCFVVLLFWFEVFLFGCGRHLFFATRMLVWLVVVVGDKEGIVVHIFVSQLHFTKHAKEALNAIKNS